MYEDTPAVCGSVRMFVFAILIEEHGPEECAFFAITPENAKKKFEEWIETEPAVTSLEQKS